MSTGAGSTVPRLCKRDGCGRPVPPHVGPGRPSDFCREGCRVAYWQARDKVRRPPAPAHAPRTCAWWKCKVVFTPSRNEGTKRYCCHQHASLDYRRTHPVDPSVSWVRSEASKRERAALVVRLRQRARSERCPACGSVLGADEVLLYCRSRCGWDLLVTAKVRDPRADTPDPAEDADE